MRRLLIGLALAVLPLAAQAQEKPSAPNQATIYRDDYGVPHIYAGSEAAGFYALGYAQAEDRPERTLYMFAFARGETAAMQGEKGLGADLRNRLWRHRDMAERGVARLSPQLRADYEAYLGGIRAYYAAHPDKKPKVGFEPDLADVLAMERGAFFFGYQSAYAEAECHAARPGQKLDVSALEAPATASNGWAVRPSRSATGALILGADPHVGNASPFYYEVHMDAGPIKSSGYSLGPFLWQMHTRNVSWSMTTGGPDVVDCYAVETDPADPGRYLYDGKWRRFTARKERFEVKGSATVERTFEYATMNGVLSPVIERKDGKAYVASAPAMDHAGRFGKEIREMNLAADIYGVRQAMKTMGMFQQNIIVGDRKGNLMYVRAGATAIRPKGYDWTRPVPGNTSATAWKGQHPLEDLVQVVNPPSGWLENNNVAPDAMTPDGPIKASDYPADVFNDTPGRRTTRGIRAAQVLSANAHVSLADAFALAFDETWIAAGDWTAALAHAARANPDYVAARSADFRAVLARLTAFDGIAARESLAAADYLAWRRKAVAVLARPEFTGFQSWPWDRSKFTPAFGLAILQALDASVAETKAAWGSAEVTLGQLANAGRAEAGWPVGGVTVDASVAGACPSPAVCEATMRAFSLAPAQGSAARRIASGSQSMRLVTFTDPIQSFSLYAFGQSDDPASPHYNDQARLFGEKRMKPTWFYAGDLKGHIESTTTLTMPEPAHD